MGRSAKRKDDVQCYYTLTKSISRVDLNRWLEKHAKQFLPISNSINRLVLCFFEKEKQNTVAKLAFEAETSKNYDTRRWQIAGK